MRRLYKVEELRLSGFTRSAIRWDPVDPVAPPPAERNTVDLPSLQMGDGGAVGDDRVLPVRM